MNPVHPAIDQPAPQRWLTIPLRDDDRSDPPERVASGGWLFPVPHFLLMVLAGAGCLTGLHLRPGAPSDDLGRAEQWLREALVQLGVGGRTAVGYDRFQAQTARGVGR